MKDSVIDWTVWDSENLEFYRLLLAHMYDPVWFVVCHYRKMICVL